MDADAAAGAIAATQYGLITQAQAIAAGLSVDAIRRRVRTGRWIRLHPRVYRLAGAPASWHQRALAAVLSVEGSALCGSSAAAVHLLDGFALTRDIELVTPRRIGSRQGVHLHESVRLLEADVVQAACIPVTTVPRTLIDLAGVVAPAMLEVALVDSLRRRLLTLERLQLDLTRFPANHPGRRHLTGLIDRYSTGAPPESGLEVAVIGLLREAGYPPPLTQQAIDDAGRFIGRVDLVWPSRGLVVEVDSYRWHSASAPWHKDLDRRNELTARGLTVLHATKRSIRRPQAFLKSFGKVWRALGTT